MLAVSLTILRNKIASGLANKIHSLPFGLYRFLPSLRWKLEDALKASEESEPRSDYRGGGHLSQIGARHRPSKVNHNYLAHYESHFGPIRNSVRNVIEIGVQTERSVRMWEEFFPQATIWGLDLDSNCVKYETGRVKIRIGSQADVTFLNEVASEVSGYGGIDIVIDDGSHIINHQMLSFETLFPQMNSHGIYVVEDTGGVVGDYTNFVLRSFMKLAEGVFRWPQNVHPRDWKTVLSLGSRASWFDRHVVGLAVYRWMIVIMKGRNPEDNPYLAA